MQRRNTVGLFWIFCVPLWANAQSDSWTLESMVGKSDQGHTVYRAKPVDAPYLNPWPQQWEREFQKRADKIVQAQAQIKANGGNTYFENEKRTYGYLMSQAIGPAGIEAVRQLEIEDAQAKEWHRETRGIDFYAAFTLKHQMRKYFYFGDVLSPEYRERMFDGAKRWTEQDPLRRAHHTHKGPKEGWGPDARNSWVDVRSTENLFLMRVTSVYLMAEETGNRSTADKYKQLILDYTKTLYRVGMGEWDSENYHGHSIAPLLNLYDFADDHEVKLAAKACLDWMMAAGAVKYYRGGFTGPTKRDYNHVQPFGGSAPTMLWTYFGDSPRFPDHWESDEVHVITSAYRPPAAVVNLARRKFARPVSVWASKPSYTATTSLQSDSAPEYLETTWIGNFSQMGSLAGGTRPGKSDVNGFKIIVWDQEFGARTIQGVPGSDALFVGSPQYQDGKVAGENRVAQDEHVAIWMVNARQAPWRWVIPEDFEVTQSRGVTFIETDRAWIALHPLGASELKRDSGQTERVAAGKKVRFPGHVVYSAVGDRSDYSGFAIEIGEPNTFSSLDHFREHIQKATVDVERLSKGIAQYKTADGKWLGFHWNDDPRDLGCWKNGTRHDWQEHARFLYRTSHDDQSPIESSWGDGTLTVRAGGATFICRVDDDGTVTFENK